MMKIVCLYLLLHLVVDSARCGRGHANYTPDWRSLDARPIPKWYDDAKLGIFMHWGLYSVPSFASEWFWEHWKGYKKPSVVKFMRDNYKPGFSYADFAPMFTAEFFNATEFAAIVKGSGARYFVPTSKHHEGFCMYPSKYSWNWNSVDCGPRRDIIGELRDATVAQGVVFGLYFSQYEWFNPLYLQDKKFNFTSAAYPTTVSIPQMHELVHEYQPNVIWSDGDWEAPDVYWKSKQFLAWLYNESPVRNEVVVNDRWGRGIMGKHGGFFTYSDKYDPGMLVRHKWENCLTLDRHSWGYRRRMAAHDVLTMTELLTQLARTVSCNGNMLLNVGPTHYGRIAPLFEERLLQLGQWMRHYGEAVYDTKPWIHQNDTLNSDVWYTSKMRAESLLNDVSGRFFNPQWEDDTVVYAILLKWPTNGKLVLGAPRPTESTTIRLLDNMAVPLKYTYDGSCMKVDLDAVHWTKLKSHDAWALKLQYLDSDDTVPSHIDRN